jgi:hypothetical protein
MKRTLFNLVLLHMFDYKIRVSEYIGGMFLIMLERCEGG